MSWTQSDAICIVLFLLLHLVLFESRRNGFDPGFHEFRSSKKNSLKTRRWWSHHVGGIWKIGFFAQAEVPKNHKSWRETPTQQEGEFWSGGAHSHLPPIMGFVVISFDFVWLTIQTVFFAELWLWGGRVRYRYVSNCSSAMSPLTVIQGIWKDSII